jgi:hypothetical protein
MKNKAIYILSFIALMVGVISFYDLGNTPNTNVSQGLTSGAMKRFVFHDSAIPLHPPNFRMRMAIKYRSQILKEKLSLLIYGQHGAHHALGKCRISIIFKKI